MLAKGRGSLIFTSTFVGHTVGFPGMAAYAASKARLIGLTQVLAAELGPKGIRVNAILVLSENWAVHELGASAIAAPSGAGATGDYRGRP
jgi:NAD(P)-dependent dehydrogenase (short-subunit alcohol dehydrogenase family)